MYKPQKQEEYGAVFDNNARPGRLVCEVCQKTLPFGNNGDLGVRQFLIKKNNVKLELYILRDELRGGLGGGKRIFYCDLCLASTLEFLASELREKVKQPSSLKEKVIYTKR